MKKGKKAIALLLALCMTLSLSVTGFAADAESEPTAINEAEEEEAEGTLGSVHWKLAGSVMTIYGDGSMGGTTSAGTYTNNKSPIYDYRESVTEVIIEYGVTDVSGYVFSSFSNLTKVTIPGSVTEIGNGAFYNCTSLTEIEIPQSVTSIGMNTFNGCSSLKNITIPAGVTSIGSNAFQNSGVTEITFMGDPPTMNTIALTGVTGVGYYPAALSGWTNSVLSSTYGGSFTWTPMTVEGAYKGALEQAVFVAGEKTESQYSEESWTAMQQALSTAEVVDGDTNAAQDAVNEAEMALRSAISVLDPKMTVQISSEADLRRILRDTEDYTKNDTLAVELVGDITLTESVTDLRNPAVISIDGKEYSLNGSGSNAMIAPLMASYWQTAGITLQDLVVDAKDQQFFVGYNINNSGDFTLNKVEMKNVRGSGTGGNAGISLYTGSGLTNVTLNDVTTEGCTGVLLYLGRCNVQVTDCTLISSSYLDSEVTVQGRLIYLGNGNSSNWNDLTLTDSSLTVDDPEECGGSSILYMDTYSRAALNGCGINGVESSYMIYTTGNSLSNKNSLTIQDTVFSNLDETTAEIYENDANTDLTIYGDVKGDFVVRLGGSTPTGITLGSALQQDLKFYYGSSILGTDPIVAKGSTEHPLDEDDLEKLVYTETNPLRSVKMTSESGETDICRLYRTDMADCDVALDATGAEGTYDGDNGNGPVFLRNENNGALEPDVIVTLDGKVLSAGNYTVEYSGTTKVPEGSPAGGDPLDALATVNPTGDLTGDSETLPYYIEVKMLYELTADNTKTVLTYEDGKYGTEVTYYGQNNTEGIDLTEDEDYTAAYRIDEDSYTVIVTVTGVGDYAGSYEAAFDLPGKQTVTNEAELNQALEQRMAYIEFGEDIDDLTGSVVVDYDVVIDGAGFKLTNDSSDVILSVVSGNVTLTDVTVDGQKNASLLSAGANTEVTVTGGAVLQNGGRSSGSAITVASDATVTLENCTVQNCGELNGTYAFSENIPVYISSGGTLNVGEEVYLARLYSSISAIRNYGTLNWSGGTFDVDASEYGVLESGSTTYYFYPYSTHILNSSAAGTGTIIENQGIFNMSGTAKLNGYLLDDTDEQTQVVTGAVHVTNSGEFNMSGDAVITGFHSIGIEEGFVTNYPSGGGGVYNNGIFNMSGGTITGNSAEAAGGGVFNASLFNMTGGEVIGNTAAIGGGIYIDYARDYTHEKSSYVGGSFDAGEFYMSGGIVSDNYLTSDTIEIEGRNFGMMGEDHGSLGAVGSELYVSGGCTAEISGGTISGTTESKVASDGGEDDTEDTVKVPVGIAVVPSQDQQAMQNPDGHVVVADNASMTVTDNADIDTGIALVSWNNWSTTGYLANKEEVQNDPDTEYDITNVTEPVLTTNQDAWLELDGNLATVLKINKLDVENVTMTLTNVSGGTASADNMPNRLDYGSGIYVNPDGALVAVYKDRVTPDENDAKWLQVDGSSIFMSYETRTYEAEVTVYDDEDDEEGHTEMVETTVDAYMWSICNHTAGLEYAEEKDPTCTESGNYACWYCPVCLKLFEDEAGTIELPEAEVFRPAEGHNIRYVDEMPPTCTEEGYTAGAMCIRCGTFFDDDFNEQPASERVLKALGHNYEIKAAVPATATTDGWSEYVWCDRCETNLTEPTVLPATGVEADDSALDVAITQAEELLKDTDTYTEESLKALQEAVDAAKEVAARGTEEVSQTEINTALETLLNAIVALKKNDPGAEEDDTALNIVLDMAQALLDEGEDSPYTAGSLADLEEAVAGARELAEKEGVQAAVDSVMTAISNLEKTAEPETEGTEKSTLDALINATEAMTDVMNSSDYTDDSWSTLQEALAEAIKAAEDPEATRDDITKAMEDLTAAINGLTKAETESEPADKTDLNTAIDSAQAKLDDGKEYTAESKGALESILAAAKAIAADGNATQDEVDAMALALNAAVNALEAAGSSGTTGGQSGNKDGFVQESGEWHYYDNGTRFTGSDIKEDTRKAIDGTDGWYYIVNGKVDFSYTGVSNFSNAYGWWYINAGKVDFSKTSIEQNNYGWWRVVGGKVDFSCNSVEQNDYGWWYLVGGQVQFGYTGVANYANAYGWWYISAGKVDFSKTSIEQNNYGWWRVVGGKVDFSCNSVEQNDYGWWYVTGGKVDFSYTGVANYANAYGWWYISGGKVDFSYTGRASNNYGTWNVVNGKVVF